MQSHNPSHNTSFQDIPKFTKTQEKNSPISIISENYFDFENGEPNQSRNGDKEYVADNQAMPAHSFEDNSSIKIVGGSSYKCN